MTAQTKRSVPRWNALTIFRYCLIALIGFLLLKIATRSRQSEVSNSPLDELNAAVQAGNIENIRRLLQQPINLNGKLKTGGSLWDNIGSVGYRHPDRAPQIIQIFLEKGVDANTRANLGFTPLIITFNSYPQIVKMLLERGADPNAKNGMGHNALAYCQNNEAMELLLKAGADIHAKGYLGQTPLMNTSSPSTISLLLQKGARLEDRDAEGLTALMTATKYRNGTELVKFLLAKGANLHAVDNKGRNALDHALQNQETSCGEFLLSKGLKHRLSPAEDITHVLGFANYPVNKRKLLLALNCGIDVNIKDNFGDTALLRATIMKNDSYLRQMQINTGETTERRQKLARAVKGFVEIPELYEDAVELLLSKGADPNRANKEGLTPLMAATGNNCPTMVKILLAKGAKRDQPSRFGQTPLKIARAYGYTEIESLLSK